MEFTVEEILQAKTLVEQIFTFKVTTPADHASYWLANHADVPSLRLSQQYPTKLSRIQAVKNRLSDSVREKLERRNDADNLFEALFLAWVRFELPIFHRTYFTHDAVTKALAETTQRMKSIQADVAALERVCRFQDISNLAVCELSSKLAHLKEVVEQGAIIIDSEQERLLIHSAGINPAVATILDDYVLKRAKGQPKDYYLQVLCCIVYLLLKQHAWSRTTKETAKNKHNLTIEIVKAFMRSSPTTAKSITCAFVERATRPL